MAKWQSVTMDRAHLTAPVPRRDLPPGLERREILPLPAHSGKQLNVGIDTGIQHPLHAAHPGARQGDPIRSGRSPERSDALRLKRYQKRYCLTDQSEAV